MDKLKRARRRKRNMVAKAVKLQPQFRERRVEIKTPRKKLTIKDVEEAFDDFYCRHCGNDLMHCLCEGT